MLQALDLRHQALVVGEEGHRARRPLGDLALHQALADEELAAQRGVDVAVGHAAARVDHQAVERAALPGAHRTGGLRPVRLEDLALDQVAADLLHPLRLDARDAAPEQARGLDLLGGHDPFAGLLRQRRAGMRPEADAARAEVGAGLRALARRLALIRLAADVAEQAGEQRLVDRLVVRRLRVLLPAVFGAQGVELGEHVAPLAHAHVVEEVLLAPGLLLARGLVALHLVPGLPQVPVPQELGLLVLLAAAKPRVRLVGCAGAVLRTLARILHRQRSSDHQQLGERAAVARGEDHAADARVERQLRELDADRRELALIVIRDGAEFGKQRITVADQPRARHVDEGEVLHRAQLQGLHAQDHAGERGAQDLGVGVRLATVEIILVVQAEADAVHHPAAAARTLLRGRLRDLLDL